MDKKARSVALGAILASAVTVATMLSIPVPGFRLYFNLGEGVIYVIALMLGPLYGAACGGIGACLGDLILGYPLWAPFTLLIKGTEGYVTGRIGRKHPKTAIMSGALVMICGYTLMAGLLYGWKAAPFEMVTDFVQTGIGGVAALILLPVLEKRVRGTSAIRTD